MIRMNVLLKNLFCGLVFVSLLCPTTVFSQEDNECAAPGCCEEDCCLRETRWDGQYCVEDLDSDGWDGFYSPDHDFGCVRRVCCGEDCCADDTYYVEKTTPAGELIGGCFGSETIAPTLVFLE